MVYLITYDLNRPGQNYESLYKAIKSYGSWAKPLESTWLIDTREKANQISDRLRPHIDKNDSLLVTEIGNDRAGWLSKEIWNWLDGRKAA